MPRGSGMWAYWEVEWFQLQWAGPIAGHHIMVQEPTSIIIAAAIWGSQWRGKIVLCDNSAVVSILNKAPQQEPEGHAPDFA